MSVATVSVDSGRIRSLRVLPPLGIARVGNCGEDAADPFADDFLVTTEVVGGMATRPDGAPASTLDDFRDADGAIRRHAARFRVYATMDDGTETELTLADGVAIEWRVALANLKAGWYEFNQAMDLPGGLARPAKRRNAAVAVAGGARAALDVTPRPRTISGASTRGAAHQFGDGTFRGKPVYLGELRTDAEGRLLVLGGRGLSASEPPNRKPTTFANNEDWHDDVADGPVRATVRFSNGATMEAEAGHVAVTPPNYAPGLVGLVTMDDAVRETFMDAGWLDRPSTTSFSNDVWPIFKRLSDLQWVNQGLFIVHGHEGPLDADGADVIARMRDASAAGEPWRRAILGLFRRDQDLLAPDEGRLPQIYGDAEGEAADPACMAITRTQHGHLERWAAGDFADDRAPPAPPPAFETLPACDQVAQLERAALHDCLGGPFHPGIELTWTMRIPRIWKGAYRLNVVADDAPARQDWGDILTPMACTGPGGPYDGVAVGALTRFLGVPWQTDGASCNSEAEYKPSYFLSMPTFWGARVPDQVLSSENALRVVANAALGRSGQAMKHFASRSDWLRDVRGRCYPERIATMVAEWHDLGMVLPVSTGASGFPEPLRAEQGRSADYIRGDVKPTLVAELEGGPAHLKAALGAAPGMAQASSPPPGRPRRSYRQGEI